MSPGDNSDRVATRCSNKTCWSFQTFVREIDSISLMIDLQQFSSNEKSNGPCFSLGPRICMTSGFSERIVDLDPLGIHVANFIHILYSICSDKAENNMVFLYT